jgi:galactoside O-acetyltransferase
MATATDAGSAQYDKSLLKQCGEDVFISANIEIRRPQLISVGSHTAIDSHVYITTGAEIGDYVHISPFTSIIGGASAMLYMGHFTGMAAGCRIICASDEHLGHGLTNPTVPEAYRDNVNIAPVRFENFATVGSNVIIMPGITLGEGCVVGANSLVTKDLQPWTIYVGSPARAVKVRPRERMLAFAAEMGY